MTQVTEREKSISAMKEALRDWIRMHPKPSDKDFAFALHVVRDYNPDNIHSERYTRQLITAIATIRSPGSPRGFSGFMSDRPAIEAGFKTIEADIQSLNHPAQPLKRKALGYAVLATAAAVATGELIEWTRRTHPEPDIEDTEPDPKAIFDVFAEAKAENDNASSAKTTLTADNKAKYYEVIAAYSETGNNNQAALNGFLEELRSLNTLNDGQKTQIIGRLLYHGAHTGSIRFLADVIGCCPYAMKINFGDQEHPENIFGFLRTNTSPGYGEDYDVRSLPNEDIASLKGLIKRVQEREGSKQGAAR